MIDVVAVYALIEPGAIDLAEVLEPLSGASVPILAVVGGPTTDVVAVQRSLAAVGEPAHDTPFAAAVGLRALIDDARPVMHPTRPVAALDQRITPHGVAFDEAQAKQFLSNAGISVPQSQVCDSAASVRNAFDAFPRPVVLKILDAEILHKTEIGGVHVGITTLEQLEVALAHLQSIGAARFLLEAMAPAGIDVLVSARRDPSFGPIVTLAVGGVYAELFDDVAIRLAPIDHAEAVRMTADLRMSALFDGWRGQPPVDVESLAEVVCRLGDALVDDSGLCEIEINPLRIVADGPPQALDAVMLVMEAIE